MAIIAAINYEERQVMLEDERVLPVTKLYNNPRGDLNYTEEDEVDEWEDATHFRVDVPVVADGSESGICLIVELASISTYQSRTH